MSFQNLKILNTTSTTWVGAGASTTSASPTLLTMDVTDADSAVVTAVLDVTTPSAKQAANADWNATTNIVTEATHGFVTGLVGQLTTTSALPTGLSLATNYYIIALTAGTYSLASSLANALAGTAIDFTDAGTGDHTFTPTTFAGTLKLQGSIDDEATWFDIPNETKTVTADGNSIWELDYIRYKHLRLYPNITAGYATLSAKILTKGA